MDITQHFLAGQAGSYRCIRWSPGFVSRPADFGLILPRWTRLDIEMGKVNFSPSDQSGRDRPFGSARTR